MNHFCFCLTSSLHISLQLYTLLDPSLPRELFSSTTWNDSDIHPMPPHYSRHLRRHHRIRRLLSVAAVTSPRTVHRAPRTHSRSEIRANVVPVFRPYYEIVASDNNCSSPTMKCNFKLHTRPMKNPKRLNSCGHLMYRLSWDEVGTREES
jgi:hypothetical protein